MLKTRSRDLVEANITVSVPVELERVEFRHHRIISVIFTPIIPSGLATYTPCPSVFFLSYPPISVHHHLLARFIEHFAQLVNGFFSELELDQAPSDGVIADRELSFLRAGVNLHIDIDNPAARPWITALGFNIDLAFSTAFDNALLHIASPGLIHLYYNRLPLHLHTDSEPIGDSRSTVTNLTTPRRS